MVAPIASRLQFLERPPFNRVLSLIDQGFVSIANFGVTITLVRSYSQTHFAAFSLAMFLALAVAGVYRMGLVVPVSLWPKALFARRYRSVAILHIAAVGIATLLALAMMVALYALGASEFWIDVSAAFVVCILIYASIDIDRVLVLRSRGLIASCGVSFSLASALLTFCASIYWFRPGFEIAIEGLGAIALAKTLVVNFSLQPRNSRHALAIWGSMSRQSLSWGALGNLASSVYATVPQWVLGIVAPPAQVAGFAAVRTPLQPMMIFLRAFDVVDKVAYGNIDQSDKRAVAHAASRTVCLYVAASASFAAVMSYFAADIIDILLGRAYAEFAPTLRLTAIAFIITATSAPLESIVFKQGRFREYTLHQFAGMVLAAVTVYPLISNFQAAGAVLAATIGWLPPFMMLFRQFIAIVRDGRSASPEGGELVVASAARLNPMGE